MSFNVYMGKETTLLDQLDYYLRVCINHNHHNNAILHLYHSIQIKKCFCGHYHLGFLQQP